MNTEWERRALLIVLIIATLVTVFRFGYELGIDHAINNL